MEHVRQFDWYTTEHEIHFVNEQDLDNCVTEKILRNKFYDPLAKFSNENVEQGEKINWDEVFKKRNNKEHTHRCFVPGLKPYPPFPKLSALDRKQHWQCLKVLSSQNPHVLVMEEMYRPTKADLKVFEDVKEIYKKEQNEYIEWAKTLWTNNHCIRALRPKPLIETIYEGEFKLRRQTLNSYPKSFTMAAQIPLDAKGEFELVHKKDLIKVKTTDIPQIDYPTIINKKISVMSSCSAPEPCYKHPCRFILPNEKSQSIMPLSEILRELAQYAAESEADYIASESALKCLMETDRSWTLPLVVCEGLNTDGEKVNISVFGSEFPISKEGAPMRTYRAYRHLLHHSFIPASELLRISETRRTSTDSAKVRSQPADEHLSDDDDDRLLIDIQVDLVNTNIDSDINETEITKERKKSTEMNKLEENVQTSPKRMRTRSTDIDRIGVYSCKCKESLLENPPPRSYKLWEVKNKTTNSKHNILVHCAHKTKGIINEVLLEPIVEYQVDLAGTRQSDEKIKSLALSLMLRKNADLINVRVVADSGDIILIDRLTLDEFKAKHEGCEGEVAQRLHTALDQIQGLMPGKYILKHEPNHGANVLLYRAGCGDSHDTLSLDPPATQQDEAKHVKNPPLLAPVLLPWHKFRRILPCAFTPFENLIAKEPKKPVTRQKPPPQALKLDGEEGAGTQGKWPKKNRKRKRNN